MHVLKELYFKNFRCFSHKKISFLSPITVIEGANGSGKTSILEAIHYFCYVRSFRTNSPHDLVHFGSENFFLSAFMNNDEITIGSTGTKRHIKINQKSITSYKELRNICKIITITQEDSDIIRGGPEKRRNFLDHALLLYNPDSSDILKAFRYLLDTRNAFLAQKGHVPLGEEFELWTKKFWTISTLLQKARKDFLELLLTKTTLFENFFLSEHTFSFVYQAKQGCDQLDWPTFFDSSQALFERERFYKRTLFGAHLDDIEIIFNGKPARIFSSRGQQKLLGLFLKILQISSLKSSESPLIFLLDDFISDFDLPTLEKILNLCLSLDTQFILTTPLSSSPELAVLKRLQYEPTIISL